MKRWMISGRAGIIARETRRAFVGKKSMPQTSFLWTTPLIAQGAQKKKDAKHGQARGRASSGSRRHARVGKEERQNRFQEKRDAGQ